MAASMALVSFASAFVAVALTVEIFCGARLRSHLLSSASEGYSVVAQNPSASRSLSITGNRFLALPREIRDHVYDYHVLNATGKHITAPVYLGPPVLPPQPPNQATTTALRFCGRGFAGFGLDTTWRDFREAHGLSPPPPSTRSSRSFDPRISPELEAAYLRNGTFHTSLLCTAVTTTGAVGAEHAVSQLRRFFEALDPGVASSVRRLQLRLLAEGLPHMVSVAALEERDRERQQEEEEEGATLQLRPASADYGTRQILRLCAVELVRLLMEVGFYGRVSLLGETVARERVFDVALVKMGLEVADRAWKEGKGDEERVLWEVMHGREMVEAVGDKWTSVADPGPDAWCSVDVDFSKHGKTTINRSG